MRIDTLSSHSAFAERLCAPLRAEGIGILQMNVGYRCNLECRHCHVSAGPMRHETMSVKVMERALDILKSYPISTIDITGGSPEMHPRMEWLLSECASLKRRLIVRSNGVILLEGGYRHFVDIYAENGVELCLSLPHLEPGVTDRQRGEGVFSRIVQAITLLNARGYGQGDGGLTLNLVHNPVGSYIPGSQTALEAHYRRVLFEKYGISFNHLFCITNMPIGRYLDYLQNTDNYDEYVATLVKSFNSAALKNAMCRTTLSVAWDGRLYDCDFNQTLGLPVDHGVPDNIIDFDMKKLAGRQIVVGNQCFGCTAGAGSSCQGEVAENK